VYEVTEIIQREKSSPARVCHSLFPMAHWVTNSCTFPMMTCGNYTSIAGGIEVISVLNMTSNEHYKEH